MTSITTDRLTIKPTHKNCWSIYDNVDQQMIGKLFFRNQWFNILLKPQSLKLGVATEASYGLMKAINSERYKAKTKLPHAQAFLRAMGFVDHGKYFSVTAETLTYPDPYHELNQQLHIDCDQIKNPKQNTAVQLVDSDKDCFDRPTKLHPKAHQAWTVMKLAASSDGVTLQLVSGFRSMHYQAQLIRNKLTDGQSIADILTTNAAPGHSEHHTGCAIDITTNGFKPLESEFDQSHAFQWLTNHAHKFGFTMSYPKDNDYGFVYEPWHWAYKK